MKLLRYLFIMLALATAASAAVIDLNVTSCTGGTSCSVTNYNVNDTSIGHTIPKTQSGFVNWSSFPGSAQAAIQDVELHLRYNHTNPSNNWTITLTNKAGTTTYCSNSTIPLSSGDVYVVWNTTSVCNWNASSINDLSINFTNGASAGGSADALIYYADVFVTYNDTPSATTPLIGTPSAVVAGGSIIYTLNASDPEADQYRMTICKTNSITTGYPGACASGQGLCTSSATNSVSQASCSYTTTQSDIGTLTAYAFVCDSGSGQCNLTATSTATTVVANLCHIEDGNSTCGSGTKIIGMQNDTGGHNNAHAENYTNTNFQNSLCCSISGDTLTHTCGTVLLKLYSDTDSHVELNNQSNYLINVCMSGATTNLTCRYVDGSCNATESCIISFSDGGTNETNMHVADCSEYTRKLCCNSNTRPSVPVLITPTNNNNSVFLRFTYFNWTSTDPDGDPITYYWNISSPTGCAAIPEKSLSTNYYTSVDKLCVDKTYNWTVKACDALGCSAYATPFNFTIPSVVGLTFNQTSVAFGLMLPSTPGQNSTNSTLSDNPLPLVYNNTGNVDINVSVKANAALWVNQPLNTSYFEYADENSTNWQNFTTGYTLVLGNLSYPGGTRQLEINVTTPQSEPLGVKNTSITALGAMIE